jgi:hypothetical protein
MSSVKITTEKLDAQKGIWLAAAAKDALTRAGFPRPKGLCQRFVRMTIQAIYGAKYDRYFRGTADETMKAFQHSPYSVPPESGSIIGDILYKKGTRGQRAGHVGIRIAGNRVAENSSAHFINGDARGTRSLEEFGDFDLIVRLPNDAK